MRTSKEVASLAARILADPSSATEAEIKDIAASALAQRQEDFDNEDEYIIPVVDGKNIEDDLPVIEDTQSVDTGVDGEDEDPIDHGTIAAVADISPKVLTDAFCAELSGVVVPTRKTAVRMTEFVVGYLENLAAQRD